MKRLIGYAVSVATLAMLYSGLENWQNVAAALVVLAGLLRIVFLVLVCIAGIDKSQKTTTSILQMQREAKKPNFFDQGLRIATAVTLAYFGMFFPLCIQLLGIAAYAVARAGLDKEVLERGADV
jgi:hypothetical protein